MKSYRRFERSYCLLQYRAVHYLMTLSYLFMLRIFEWKTYSTIRVQRFKLSYTFGISWPCRWSCCYPWKRRWLFAQQHLETSQKSRDCNDTALRTSNFAIYIVGLGCLSHLCRPPWVSEWIFSVSCLCDRATLIYNNINSRLDATMIILLTISISSTCFGR